MRGDSNNAKENMVEFLSITSFYTRVRSPMPQVELFFRLAQELYEYTPENTEFLDFEITKLPRRFFKKDEDVFKISEDAIPHLVPFNIFEEPMSSKGYLLLPPSRWQSANMLEKSRKYTGSREKFSKIIAEYGEEKIEECKKSGMAEEEAKRKVSEEYVGMYQAKKGPATLYASPEVIKELEERGKLPLASKKLALPPSSWQSAKMLEKSRKYTGGREKFSKILAAYQEEKIEEFKRSGMDEEAAKRKVSEEYVGMYQVKKGTATLYASPEVIKELEERGKLRRRKGMGREIVEPKEWVQRISSEELSAVLIRG